MRSTQSSLEDDVVAALERAYREQDFMVAEYLLQALEAIAKRNGDERRLQHALAAFARSVPAHERHS